MTRIDTMPRAIRTRADLAAILPAVTAARVRRGEILGDRHAAGALRVLAVMPQGAWCLAIKRDRIDVDELVHWTAQTQNASVRVLVCVAVGIYGGRLPHPSLHSIIQLDDDEQFAAVVDGLRIAREGLAR